VRGKLSIIGRRGGRTMNNLNSLEGVILGALKSTIKAHGEITKKSLSSATKRIYGQIREFLVPFTSKDVENFALLQKIKSIMEENKKLRIKNRELKIKVSFLGNGLQRIRDCETKNPSITAQCWIIEARKIKVN
jgi:regulator of replication initiation timing